LLDKSFNNQYNKAIRTKTRRKKLIIPSASSSYQNGIRPAIVNIHQPQRRQREIIVGDNNKDNDDIHRRRAKLVSFLSFGVVVIMVFAVAISRIQYPSVILVGDHRYSKDLLSSKSMNTNRLGKIECRHTSDCIKGYIYEQSGINNCRIKVTRPMKSYVPWTTIALMSTLVNESGSKQQESAMSFVHIHMIQHVQ
jgi:hypothetical protein